MGSGILNVGVTGLNAAQMGVLTTSHNISNASTPGYTRQYAVQSSNTPLYTGSGYIGQGTNVLTVQRAYSKFLTEQVLSAQSGASEMDSYLQELNQISNMLADPSAGLTPALSSFFKGVQDVAASPSSVPARQSMLSTAQALASRFQGLDQRISEVRDGVNQQVMTEATTINSLAQQLADVNQRIILAQSAGTGQPPNDILDQRDTLVAQMNQEVKTQTLLQSDGTYSVFIGNGQPLVIGTLAYGLSAVQAPDDPEKLSLALTAPGGVKVNLQDDMITGGKLGGLLAFRSKSLDPVQNALGRVAYGLTQQFNEIQRQGQDLNGVQGTDFFTTSAPDVKGNTLNIGTGMVSASIINSDYRVAYNGVTSSYDVTRLSDGTAFTNQTLPAVLDGISFSVSTSVSGTPSPNDSFIVRPGNPPGSRVIPQATNLWQGTLDSSGSNVQALTTSDYRLDYTNPNEFRLTRLSDNATWISAPGAISVQAALDDLAKQQQTGFVLAAPSSGTLNQGDSFTIRPTRFAARNIVVALTTPQGIAAGLPFRTSAPLTNSGKATISAGTVEYVAKPPATPNFPLTADVTLTFDSINKRFDITVNGAPPAWAAPNTFASYDPTTQTNANISINGMSFTISGTPANGDKFVLSANANGVSDNRNAQLLAGLQTRNTLAGSAGSTSSGATASYAATYAQIVSEVGNKSREVEVTGNAQQTLVDQAESARQSLSGVNLDEEAANLMRYQQAYQASAKMIDIAGKLFDSILALG